MWELLILDWRLNISTSQIQYQEKSKMWKNCQLIHLICQLAILKENIDLRSQSEKWMALFLSIALTGHTLCPWERLDFQKVQDYNKFYFIHLMKTMRMHFKQEIFMLLIRGLNVANTVIPILLLLQTTQIIKTIKTLDALNARHWNFRMVWRTIRLREEMVKNKLILQCIWLIISLIRNIPTFFLVMI